MKTSRSFLLIAVLSPAVLFLSSCSKPGGVEAAVDSTKTAASDLVSDVKTTAADSWDSVKDYTYGKRDDFAASLDRMAVKRDAEIQAMNAKVAGLPDTAAKARDHAVKEYSEASSQLKSELADLRTSTADTWNDAKAKAAQSWQRVQAAYEKVKASPTS